MYSKEQILIFETSNGMIDSHVGDPMQVHVPIFRSLILHAFKRLGSDPQQYRGQSAILYSLTTHSLASDKHYQQTAMPHQLINGWWRFVFVGLLRPDQHT